MVTGRELFVHRLKGQLKFYTQIYRMTVYWAVWVYIIIPFSIIGLGMYIDLWRGYVDLGLLSNEFTAPLLVLIVVMSSYSTSFLRGADILFLWQKQSIFKRLNRSRWVYFVSLSLFKTWLLMLIIAPIFIQYLEWSVLNYTYYALFASLLNASIGIIKREMKVRFSNWTNRFFLLGSSVIVYLILMVLYHPVLSIFVLIALITMFLQVTKQTQKFNQEIALDLERKNTILRLILMQSSHIGAPEFVGERLYRKRENPWIFRKSKKLFKKSTPEAAFEELYIKALLRNKNWLSFYVQVTLIGVMGVIFVPVWVKLILWMLILFIIGVVLKVFWIQVMSNQFLQIVQWQHLNLSDITKSIFQKAMLPGAMLISVTLGYNVLSFLGLLIMPVIGFGLTFVLANYLSRSVRNE